MQPQTIQKPVMDVAAPPKVPASPANALPVAPKRSPFPASSPVLQPVQPTALPVIQATSPLAVKAAPASPETPVEAAAAMPSLPEVAAKTAIKQKQPAANKSHTPIGLITMTVITMLVLAGLAVVIYVTSA